MNILLFSGTTEGRTLSEELVRRGHRVTVCVATEYGREEQEQVSGAAVLTGRKTGEEMEALLREHDLCVDATHPYATEVTAALRAAAERTGTRYVRIRRALGTPGSASPENARYFSTADEAAAYLKTTDGNVLVTTGTKELPLFAGLAPERLYPRVLPSAENLKTCEELSIPHRNIVAMQGPFSREMNEVLLREKDIAFLVTKDGGPAGGFPEKAEAARATGAELLVIAPPEDDGLTLEEFLEEPLC
ncbi:MAG: precorrin-6A reductase [Clostridia bacterium]|nr:precorrin-6A reductase [Clostridia bacterium]